MSATGQPGTPAPAPGAGAAPAAEPAAGPAPGGAWRRLWAASRARPDRAQVLLAALLFALGFAVVTQAQQAAGLSGLRQSDLVRLLDDASERRSRLEAERSELEQRLEGLTSSSGSAAVARAAAEEQRDTYAILAGTSPAVGPGVRLAVDDPGGVVTADDLLNAVQELRAAGAEAIQIADVRVVAGTAFVEQPGGVTVGGETIRSPFEILAIGDPVTLDPALRIPGGVLETITQAEGTPARLVITTEPEVLVDAVVVLDDPEFAAVRE